jgi:hypothetical protein
MKYDYKVNDLILLNRGTLQRKLVPKRDEPYQIIRLHSNGNLKIRKSICMYNECQYVNALLILIATRKEAKCHELASMRTSCD